MNVGDIVRLNSGGPNMTVVRVGHEFVECCWFDDADDVHTGRFPQGALRNETA